MTFEQMSGEWERQKLSHRYARFVDRGDGKARVGLFTLTCSRRTACCASATAWRSGLDAIEGIAERQPRRYALGAIY
jgi:hypothetical protein